jgi:ankyrin repeat protein
MTSHTRQVKKLICTYVHMKEPDPVLTGRKLVYSTNVKKIKVMAANQDTPLHTACINGNMELVKFLVDNGPAMQVFQL